MAWNDVILHERKKQNSYQVQVCEDMYFICTVTSMYKFVRICICTVTSIQVCEDMGMYSHKYVQVCEYVQTQVCASL